MQEAEYYTADVGRGVQCTLCPHKCVINEGQSGICQTRSNVDGQLIALGYGLISSAHLDPIEKKPLAMFMPGSRIFSIGGWGCNFRCPFCQNWTISQTIKDDGKRYSPRETVEMSRLQQSIGIAYTYNEPLINHEFVKDCAQLVHDNGATNVLVTNGYINSEPARELLPLIDAVNIDIKSIKEDFYSKQCGASLQPVLDFAVQAAESGCHVELTNLIIPELNDSESTISELVDWVLENLGSETALHLSAYHPQYKVSTPATSLTTMECARNIARGKLNNVFLGNVTT